MELNDFGRGVFALGRQLPSGIQILGTAFAVGVNSLATAHHVLSGDDSQLMLILPHTNNLNEYQNTINKNVQCLPVRIKAANPIYDTCIVEFTDNVQATLQGLVTITGTDDSSTGAQVDTFGFPHADSGRLVLTRHTTHIGAKIIINNSSQSVKHLVLNVQAKEGQSGGPVVDSRGHIIAMITGSFMPSSEGSISLGGVNPATLHQTTHAVSAEYVKEMINE